MKLPSSVIDDTRRNLYSIVFGVWALIALYAILHDQYIVRIAPEHFTLYHPPLLGITNPEILAGTYAFFASISPGLMLGLTAMIIARLGPFPKMDIKYVLKGTIFLILATELVGVLTGAWVYVFRGPFYPESVYPDKSLPLLITQTIQVSCYLCGFIFSGVFLSVIVISRSKKQKSMVKAAEVEPVHGDVLRRSS